jgi:hypothetical protein
MGVTQQLAGVQLAISGVGTDMTLDEATNNMNMLVKQGSTAAYQIGTIYNYVVQKKLAEMAGYTAQEYFSQKVKALSQATLSTYGAVARSFPQEACTLYGVYHLRALMRYAEAANITWSSDPGDILIDVPQDDGKKVVKKPFAECSVDEVERATRARKTPPTVRVPVPDQARLLFFADSISRSFDGVAPVRLSSHNEEGRTVITLQNVPMAEVPRLIQALQQGLEAQPSLAGKQ